MGSIPLGDGPGRVAVQIDPSRAFLAGRQIRRPVTVEPKREPDGSWVDVEPLGNLVADADLQRLRPLERERSLQRETRTIPIVFCHLADPVASGLVPRLDRPGGNTTGFPLYEASLGGKWLELLSEIAPGLKRAAIMFNPDINPVSVYFMPAFERAARSLKVEAITAPVHDDAEIETAIIALGREPGGGLVVMPEAFTSTHRASIISAAARNNVPAVYPDSFFARDGGLLSYSVDQIDLWRRAATYVDRILRGAKPGELPVQFPAKFEMIVNLKTAKALGLTVPETLLATADEVIQ